MRSGATRHSSTAAALQLAAVANARAELIVNRISWKRELSTLTGVPVKDLDLFPDPGSKAV